MLFKNKSGFSMIQVMIAMGLAGALSVAMMKQQETAGKMQQKMVANQDLNGITNQLQTLLANQANCTVLLQNLTAAALPDTRGATLQSPRDQIFMGESVPGTSTYRIKPGVPPVFRVGYQIPGTPFIIQEMFLYKDSTGVDKLAVSFTQGRRTPGGQIEVKKASLGSTELRKNFTILGEKNANNEFVKCYSEAGQILDNLLNELPKCMITESACTDLYPKQGEVKFEVIKMERRSCTGSYTKNACGFGAIPAPRKCYCYTPNCSCTTASITCFQRHMGPCDNDHVKEIKTYNKCCQGTGMTCPTGQMWNAVTETCVLDPNSCAGQGMVFNGSSCVTQQACTPPFVEDGLGGCRDPDPNGCGSNRTWTPCTSTQKAGTYECVDDQVGQC